MIRSSCSAGVRFLDVKSLMTVVSARDIYGYKIPLSYNFSSSYPHSFHSIPFESRFHESETQTLMVYAGKIIH